MPGKARTGQGQGKRQGRDKAETRQGTGQGTRQESVQLVLIRLRYKSYKKYRV